QAVGGEIRGDGIDDRTDVIMYLAEVDLERRPGDADGRRAAQGLVSGRRGDQRLRRNAAIGEIGAAERTFLDEHDRYGGVGRGRRQRDAARATADHADVGREFL